MAKKYVPSGYQIITIDMTNKTSGTAFTPETEDEKILHEILSSGEISKPILLSLVGVTDDRCFGFGVVHGGTIYLINTVYTEVISTSGVNQLLWDETEL